MKKPLIILTGPTAVGKTELSIALAKAIDGEIVSADSMQVYKKMDIGTAKITEEEKSGVVHHLIDVLEPFEDFNVVKFKDYAQKALDSIYERGKIPIVVGGTGFYIQALLYDIQFDENDDDLSYRNELMKLSEKKGVEYLHNLLKKVDPESAEAIHANNVKRVIRALEFYKKTGTKISEHNEIERNRKSPYNYEYFVLNMDRAVLYARIDKRIDIMLESGLVDEVKELAAQGYNKSMVSMQGLGYKEILDYLDSNISYEEAVYLLKRDTRHFAKRQITWFKREKDVTWVDKDKFDNQSKLLEFCLERLRQKEII